MVELDDLASNVEKKVIEYRRDFHKYPEMGWTEFRTSSLVARKLSDLGYKVLVGKEVIDQKKRMGVPDREDLESNFRRAVKQGGDKDFLHKVKNGFTGVVGILKNGDGPTIGMRFDMDALGIKESNSDKHRPELEGFASVNDGIMHACGHDAHTAIGLGIAEVLVDIKEQLRGTVKLIFQPAEEGVRGAKSMVHAGIVEDIDYMIGFHLNSGWESGNIFAGRSKFLATTKLDAYFAGLPSHAGSNPEGGKNALLAAATAVLNLHAISRNSDGATRINVGQLNAGTERNVICAEAHMAMETRGETTEQNKFMYEKAVKILKSAADMYECKLDLVKMGEAHSGTSDKELAKLIENTADRMNRFTVKESFDASGSEDYTYMMKRVQELGGLATNVGIGADLGGWGHHTSDFDLDETILKDVVELFARVTLELMEKKLAGTISV